MAVINDTEHITITTNAIIKPYYLRDFRNAPNLKTFTAKTIAFGGGFRPEYFYFDNCKKLEMINLQGSTGVGINDAKFVTGIYQFSPIPFSWRHLTKLGVINFRNCGFTSEQIDDLIVGLAQVVSLGMGSEAISKYIGLDGVNGVPSNTVTSHIEALQNAGWLVTHSDLSGNSEIPNISERVLNVTYQVAGTLSNGGWVDANVSVPNLPQNSNHNVVLLTNIASVQGLIVEHQVTANNNLFVRVKIEDGDDDVVIPTLNFKIYII